MSSQRLGRRERPAGRRAFGFPFGRSIGEQNMKVVVWSSVITLVLSGVIFAATAKFDNDGSPRPAAMIRPGGMLLQPGTTTPPRTKNRITIGIDNVGKFPYRGADGRNGHGLLFTVTVRDAVRAKPIPAVNVVFVRAGIGAVCTVKVWTNQPGTSTLVSVKPTDHACTEISPVDGNNVRTINAQWGWVNFYMDRTDLDCVGCGRWLSFPNIRTVNAR